MVDGGGGGGKSGGGGESRVMGVRRGESRMVGVGGSESRVRIQGLGFDQAAAAAATRTPAH